MPDTFGRYPVAALRADYLRGGAGLGLTLFPFALTEPHIVIAVPLLAAAGLFGAFSARTVQRQLSRVEVTEEGLLLHAPMGAALRWAEVTGVDLRYYSTRRDRKDGWMQLTVRGVTAAGSKRRIDLESALDGFEEVAQAVLRAAERNRLPLTEVTKENFAALGFPVAEPHDGGEPGKPA